MSEGRTLDMYLAFLATRMQSHYGVPRDVFARILWHWEPPAPSPPLEWFQPIEWGVRNNREVFTVNRPTDDALFSFWSYTLDNVEYAEIINMGPDAYRCAYCSNHIDFTRGFKFAQLGDTDLRYLVCRNCGILCEQHNIKIKAQ